MAAFPLSVRAPPVVDFGLLQLLVLPAVPLLQLHLGLLLPLCLLLAGVGIWARIGGGGRRLVRQEKGVVG